MTDALKPPEDDALDRPLAARLEPARVIAAVGFTSLGVFALGYRFLVLQAFEQTAAMFVGLPTLLAVLTVLLARPRSAIGIAITVSTLALLASAILFQEGFVCIAFSMPLFYGASILVAVLWDYTRGRRGGPRAFVAGLGPLLVLSAEGTVFDLPREGEVTAEAVVAASPAEVRAALARSPRLDTPLPASLRIGYPLPVAVEGAGLERGAPRRIHFAGGEGHPGWMVFEVAAYQPERIEFRRVEDTSHIAHWLDWDRSVVRLEEVEGGTRVRWTVHFTRSLDPGWYFDPFQRLALHAAADWLIEANATPADR